MNKDREISPIEALEMCFFYVAGNLRNGPMGKPGEVVQRVSRSKCMREALKNLRSEDISDLRQDYIAKMV